MTQNPHTGLRFAWLIFRESIRSFGANRSLQAAAMLAFYGFLSLMPLLLLLLFLFARVLNASDETLTAVRDLTSALFPAFNEDILDDLMKLSSQRVFGVVSIVLLMWSMTPFAAAVRMSLLQVFKMERKLNVVIAKLIDLGAVSGLMALFVGLVAARIWFSAVESNIPFLRSALTLALSVGVLMSFFAVFVPRGTQIRVLFAGAITCGILLAVIRPLFGLMLEYNPNYGYAFGSVKAIFLLLVWVYYTFAVILFGAEVMANIQRRESLLLRGLFTTGVAPGGVAGVLVDRFAKQLAPGEILFREGDKGSEMYYVIAGEAAVRKGGKVLKSFKAGEYFGEMSMLLDAPRTADVVGVAPDTRLIVISRDNFDTILRENPAIVKTILKEMAQRVKSTNEQLQAKG